MSFIFEFESRNIQIFNQASSLVAFYPQQLLFFHKPLTLIELIYHLPSFSILRCIIQFYFH